MQHQMLPISDTSDLLKSLLPVSIFPSTSHLVPIWQVCPSTRNSINYNGCFLSPHLLFHPHSHPLPPSRSDSLNKTPLLLMEIYNTY